MSNDPSPAGSVRLLGVRVDARPLDWLLAYIRGTVASGQRAVVANVNVHALNLACEQPWFRAFLNRSEVVFCDGFGVRLGARLTGQRLPYRYTPPDWLPLLARQCAQQGHSLYLLGARPGVAEKAAARLQAAAPGLRIAGTSHGYFDKAPANPENQAVLAAIRTACPQILIVGFGMPAQERWIQENWASLPVQVVLPVGAAIDYLAGETARAPRWMTDHGLEWLGRLVIEPGRLWRRYLVGNPLFFWRVLRQRLNLLQLD